MTTGGGRTATDTWPPPAARPTSSCTTFSERGEAYPIFISETLTIRRSLTATFIACTSAVGDDDERDAPYGRRVLGGGIAGRAMSDRLRFGVVGLDVLFSPRCSGVRSEAIEYPGMDLDEADVARAGIRRGRQASSGCPKPAGRWYYAVLAGRVRSGASIQPIPSTSAPVA
jgi:hypothetical protein